MDHTPILPATASLESIERFLPSDMGIVPLSAVARALSGLNRDQLGSAIEVLIALMDVSDGDPDAEDATDLEDDFVLGYCALLSDPGPGCALSDAKGDLAYTEWHTRGRHKLDTGIHGKDGRDVYEDDELIGDEDDGDCAEDEECAAARLADGPGCPIADSDKAIDDDLCDDPDQDMEREQLADDVPMLPVFSAAHNVYTGKRLPLGISNLMSSFVGQDVRSADTGNLHRCIDPGRQPGVPV